MTFATVNRTFLSFINEIRIQNRREGMRMQKKCAIGKVPRNLQDRRTGF